MNRILTTLLLSFTSTTLYCQVCEESFYFNTQAQMDAFLVDNPTCTSISGEVYILNDDTDPVTNVDALQNITGVSWFVFANNVQVSLAGLSSLTSVGHLSFEGTSYTDFFGLNNLAYATELEIWGQSGFDYTAFSSLHTVQNALTIMNPGPGDFTNMFPALVTLGSFGVYGTGNLTAFDFTGFSNVQTADGITFSEVQFQNMAIFDNLETTGQIWYDLCYLESLSGFENLATCGHMILDITMDADYPDFPALTSLQQLSLYPNTYGTGDLAEGPDMPLLTSMTGGIYIAFDYGHLGFVNLTDIGGDLNIGVGMNTWPSANEYSGFSSLTHIGGGLEIIGGQGSNLDFLSALNSVDGNVNIHDNVYLSDCVADFLCEKIQADPLHVTITNNLGCSSVADAATQCAFSSISGIVFADLDCDGVFNNNDAIAQNILILDQTNYPVDLSNADGEFSIPLPDNATTTLHVNTPAGYTGGILTYTVATEDVEHVANIPLCPSGTIHNLSLEMIQQWGLYQDHTSQVGIVVTNLGNQFENAVVTFDMENIPGFTIASASGGSISGNTVTWNTSITVFETQVFHVQVYVAPTVAIGQDIDMSSSVAITPLTAEVDNTDNSETQTRAVLGSYDPNDKVVDRSEIDYTEVSDGEPTELSYTIRFQNTGTAQAFNIRVEDDLESDLDVSSFQMVASSHPCELNFGENGHVEFLFADINLPDSTTNEAASHGYIHFRIHTKENLQVTDVIENAVAIYFDFNEPVITNTATTIFYDCPSPVSVSGETTICSGDDIILDASQGWDNYSWTINEGNVVPGTSLIVEDAQPGEYSIHMATASAYCMGENDVVVFVNETPSMPVISQSGNTLTASGTGIFSWTFNGQPLASGISAIEITETGTYAVIGQNGDCISGEASGVYIYTGISERETLPFLVVPNPVKSSGQARIICNNPEGISEIRIVDSTGKLIFSQQITIVSTGFTLPMLPTGLYFFSLLDTKGHKSVDKIIVE